MESERIPEISVVVPVYGVERYIERCAESLLSQTLRDGMEYIFVNDCTRDQSMEVLNKVIGRHPERAQQIRIISHEANKGLPAARNTGLAHARGKYVYHCDSDDYVDSTMLEVMLRAAEKDDADIVWCDFYLTFSQNERRLSQLPAKTGREGLSILLEGRMKYNVWNKIARRSLYVDNDISFPEGRPMGEDMTMIKLMSCSKSVAYVPEAFYHYIRTNSGAMTQEYSSRQISDLKANTEDTIAFLEQHVSDERISEEIMFFKLNVKLPFLFSGNEEDYLRWQQWYPEANKFVMLNKLQPLRSRVLQWCAANNLGFVNKLYNMIVFNIVYGKIYK